MKLVILCFIFLVLILALVRRRIRQPQLRRMRLASLGWFPFPEDENWPDPGETARLITASPLLAEDIDESFDRIGDLEWLRQPAADSRVILLGEQHEHRVISLLRNRIFFALNRWDRYPLLVMEQPWSNSPWVDHYLALPDDGDAARWFTDELSAFVETEEEAELLNHARRWNRRFPERPVTIAGSDIEHDFQTPLRRILLPHFQGLADAPELDPQRVLHMDLGELATRYRQLLEANPGRPGRHPFITDEYLLRVLDNFISTWEAYHFNFDHYRQQAMIRNLSDPRFLGEWFSRGKVMLHGGNYHAATRFEYPPGGNFFREGCWLNHDFPLTRGKAVSIVMHGEARVAGSTAEIDLERSLHQGQYYLQVAHRLQQAVRLGLLDSQTPVLEQPLTGLRQLLLSRSREWDFQPLRVEGIDWPAIRTAEKILGREDAVRAEEEDWKRYDYHVYVPVSAMTRARQKQEVSDGRRTDS